MQYLPFAGTSQSVSQYCLGCMLMGTQTDQPTSFEMLDRFMDAGGNFLDTANCYAWWIGKGEFVGDESETVLGNWMKQRGNRDKVFLATKVGGRLKDVSIIRDETGAPKWDMVRGEYEYLSARTIRTAVEGSLRRLQTDHIDLYYAHIEDRVTPLEETLGAFNQLVQEGKVRYLACSNLRTWRLERARNISAAHGWAAYTAIQQQYSYLRPKPGADLGISVNVDDELIDYLQSNRDVTLLAYSPLLKGIYDDPQKRTAYYNWNFFDTDDSRVRLETLSRIARELNVSNNQLVLAWLLHQQPVTIPIIGARTLAQYEEAMGALAIHLSPEQLNTLNQASV